MSGGETNLGSVLVLDSDRDQARQVARLLGQQKWTSVLSFSQDMALRSLKHNRFHLLLVDAYADNQNMVSQIDFLKSQMKDTPLAVMGHVWGGKKGTTILDQAKAAGADFLLAKPIHPDRLKTMLAETHRYHRERRTEVHVMVVDPDVQLRTFIGMTLQQVGYKVSVADNMEDVFFDHNLGMIDIVLTAILIPGIGGVEGIAQIKKDHPHVRLAAMSEGINDKIGAMHVLAAAREAGAEELLPKPFVMPELLSLIGRLSRDKIQARAAEAAATPQPAK
ncbi:response regulator [Asticcacaulis sp. BYS171W]|uniref:Response regulator n=1 Tax=Asticcacaulis aquaticus TaxID=2984212 RepID=A0ABT5HNT7_9CAUL|nr:response regulator [Asticcacaulis aquaticus]MDC7681654.1 response regulator [Asticcacaulis aquaticus]